MLLSNARLKKPSKSAKATALQIELGNIVMKLSASGTLCMTAQGPSNTRPVFGGGNGGSACGGIGRCPKEAALGQVWSLHRGCDEGGIRSRQVQRFIRGE